MSDAKTMSSERRFRMAVKPWNLILKELRVDRGTLLGSEQYQEMSGVEQNDALGKIDSRIKTCELWIEHYETRRNTDQYRRFNRKRVRQIRSMTDDEIGGSDD